MQRGASRRLSVLAWTEKPDSADNVRRYTENPAASRTPEYFMDLREFTLTTTRASPQAGLSPMLQALWYLRKGDWNKAHAIVQEREDEKSSEWVHAHLHRVEGDLSNAGYWYRRAGKKAAKTELEEEWKSLVAHFLAEKEME